MNINNNIDNVIDAVHNLQIDKTQRVKKFRPYYWALVFKNEDIENLINTNVDVKNIINNNYTEKKKEYHMTCKYYKNMEEDDEYKLINNNEYKVKIIGFKYTSRICGMFIDKSCLEVNCHNEYPHISIAKISDAKWMETGLIPKISSSDNKYEEIIFENPIQINGIIKKCY
jgi:hypothetical protein